MLIVLSQFNFSRLLRRCQMLKTINTDKRVQTIHELLSGCQIIKTYDWEAATDQWVRQTRLRELSSIYKSSLLRGLDVVLSRYIQQQLAHR